MRARQLMREFWQSRRWPWRLTRLLVLAVLGFYGLLMLGENHFIYHPSPAHEADYQVARDRPAEGHTGMAVTDVDFRAADGVALHGWWCQPVRTVGGKSQPLPTPWTILYCHGNAGNVSDRYDKIARLMELGVAVFIFDYRGFGRSAGRPSEAGLRADDLAAWQVVTREYGVPPAQVVLYGESLGGSQAVYLATQVPAGALVVESGFTSVPDMAAATMPFVPRWLVRTQMNSLAQLAQTQLPTLIIHGTVDGTVPFHMGEQLYAAAPGQPKQFAAIAGADHNDLYLVAGQHYVEVWRTFLSALPAPVAAAPGP